MNTYALGIHRVMEKVIDQLVVNNPILEVEVDQVEEILYVFVMNRREGMSCKIQVIYHDKEIIIN